MNDDRPRKFGGGCVISIAVIMLAVIYVLSVGPAIWFRDHDFISQDTILVVYAPIGWLYDKVPFAAQLLEAYAGLWASPPSSN